MRAHEFCTQGKSDIWSRKSLLALGDLVLPKRILSIPIARFEPVTKQPLTPVPLNVRVLPITSTQLRIVLEKAKIPSEGPCYY